MAKDLTPEDVVVEAPAEEVSEEFVPSEVAKVSGPEGDAPVQLDIHNPEHGNLTYEELQALS